MVQKRRDIQTPQHLELYTYCSMNKHYEEVLQKLFKNNQCRKVKSPHDFTVFCPGLRHISPVQRKVEKEIANRLLKLSRDTSQGNQWTHP